MRARRSDLCFDTRVTMKRLGAAIVLFVLVAGPALAAVPAAGMMEDCMEAGMTCHDQAVLSCCSANPLDAIPPATRATSGAAFGVTSGPSQHVVEVISPSACPGFSPVNASPPHGYHSGDLLSRLSTLLI